MCLDSRFPCRSCWHRLFPCDTRANLSERARSDRLGAERLADLSCLRIPSMGLMRFRVFPTERITEEMVQQAYLSGIDRMSWPVWGAIEGGDLLLQRSVSDSANLHVPWPVEGYGPLTLTSGSLIERRRAVPVAAGTRPRHDRPGPQPTCRMGGDRVGGSGGGPRQAGGGRNAVLLGGGDAGRASDFQRARRGGACVQP